MYYMVKFYGAGVPIPISTECGTFTETAIDRAERIENNKVKLAKRYLTAEEHKKHSEGLGGFYFTRRSDNKVFTLTAPTAGRIAYLATYSDYHNKLIMDNYKPIIRKNLHKILKVSKCTTNRFLKECIDTGIIIENDDNSLYLSSDFYRGQSQDDDRVRIYRNTVRSLYNKLTISQHKYFGYIVKLIPYINIRWNLICDDIYEEDFYKLQNIPFTDVCKLIGYDTSNLTHTHRLKHILESIECDVNGEMQSLCIFMFAKSRGKNVSCIYINPSIIYVGGDIESLKVITAMFKNKAKALADEDV